MTKKIEELIPKSLIQFDQNSVSWQEAVKTVGRILFESNFVEERYISAMIRTVEELGPYIVITPGVAIAHARPEDGVLKPGLSCIKTANPIFFGNKENDPAHIVFGLAAVDHKQHLDAFRIIAEVLMDENKRSQLFSAKNVEDIVEVLYSE